MHEDLIYRLRLAANFDSVRDAAATLMHDAADALEAIQMDAERMDWLESTVRHYGDAGAVPDAARGAV